MNCTQPHLTAGSMLVCPRHRMLSDNSNPHQLCWGDREMETALSYTECSQGGWPNYLKGWISLVKKETLRSSQDLNLGLLNAMVRCSYQLSHWDSGYWSGGYPETQINSQSGSLRWVNSQSGSLRWVNSQSGSLRWVFSGKFSLHWVLRCFHYSLIDLRNDTCERIDCTTRFKAPSHWCPVWEAMRGYELRKRREMLTRWCWKDDMTFEGWQPKLFSLITITEGLKQSH